MKILADCLKYVRVMLIAFCAQSAKPRVQWPSMLAPEVRSQFAQRLKNLRTQRGFDRARYFAKSLGIEENRYTRYERAEVEPSLTLIHKMCETLRVSPNELLGFADPLHQDASGVPGLAEAAAGGDRARRPGAQGGAPRGLAGVEPGGGGGRHPP